MTTFNLLPSFREDSAFSETWQLHSSTPEAVYSVIKVHGTFSVHRNREIPVCIQSAVFLGRRFEKQIGLKVMEQRISSLLLQKLLKVVVCVFSFSKDL